MVLCKYEPRNQYINCPIHTPPVNLRIVQNMAFEGFIETPCTKQRENVTWNLCFRAAQDELKND